MKKIAASMLFLFVFVVSEQVGGWAAAAFGDMAGLTLVEAR